MNKLVYGTDPEFFILNSNGFILPPPTIENIKAVKDNGKHPIFYNEDDCRVIMDGAAFEINVSPSVTAGALSEKVQKAINWLETTATKYGWTVGRQPACQISMLGIEESDLDDNVLLQQCFIHGCDQDTDAFGDNGAARPTLSAIDVPYRFAGGHLHISEKKPTGAFLKYPEAMIRLLAIFCGNYSVISSPHASSEKIRKQHYGTAGKYRIQEYADKKHGLEYRTPSNYWVQQPETVSKMLELAEIAYEKFMNIPEGRKFIAEFADKTKKAVSSFDVPAAKYIFNAAMERV